WSVTKGVAERCWGRSLMIWIDCRQRRSRGRRSLGSYSEDGAALPRPTVAALWHCFGVGGGLTIKPVKAADSFLLGEYGRCRVLLFVATSVRWTSWRWGRWSIGSIQAWF